MFETQHTMRYKLPGKHHIQRNTKSTNLFRRKTQTLFDSKPSLTPPQPNLEPPPSHPESSHLICTPPSEDEAARGGRVQQDGHHWRHAGVRDVWGGRAQSLNVFDLVLLIICFAFHRFVGLCVLCGGGILIKSGNLSGEETAAVLSQHRIQIAQLLIIAQFTKTRKRNIFKQTPEASL